MRIDRLLCCLRFTRTRGLAQKLVATGHLRRNGERITRPSLAIRAGDILTVPLGQSVRLIEILSLPDRRGPPQEAEACYRMLDPADQTAIASGKRFATKDPHP